MPPKDAFQERSLTLADFSTDREVLRWSRALLIVFDADSVIDSTALTLALDHGLQVFVVAATDKDQQLAINQLQKSTLLESVTLRTAGPWTEVAERCRDHDPKAGIGDVEIFGSCDDNDAFLLRRAFADCKTIRIEPIGGGLSGAHVFRVHATFEHSAAGPRPLPFFAKSDAKLRIEREITNYGMYVDRFIPFYLRPHLDHTRCLDSHLRGLLVGDFVASSEPLTETLRANRGRSALNSLFDESLRSWRLQAFESERGVVVGRVPSAIYSFDPGRFSGSRVAAAKAAGARCDPGDLVARLEAVTALPYRSGPIHADLNCANIQVRVTDAIVIDFYTTKTGPIVADPAALEVDVAFSHDTTDDFDQWRDLIDKLYGPSYLSKIPPPSGEPTRREWIWETIRQVRMHGRAVEPAAGEYEQAIAVYLLKRAQYPSRDEQDEKRRTYAYVVADAVIRGLK
jgi:hypothetical protein